MADFNVRSDSVNVEQIMEQIRARIREKRGIDYTEEQIRELAAVKLEKFLDPRGVRSDLLEQFKQHQPRYSAPDVPSFVFEDTTMFETHRGALRFIRKLLYGVQVVDPSVILVVTSLFLLSAATAAFLPARRAASVDPMEALRAE